MVDGKIMEGQTDDGIIPLELCGSARSKLPTYNPILESNARPNTKYKSTADKVETVPKAFSGIRCAGSSTGETERATEAEQSIYIEGAITKANQRS